MSGQLAEDSESFFKSQHDHVILSRDLRGDYEVPMSRTWTEASDMCAGRDMSLPSFVSQEDVDSLVNYLKHVSWSALVTHLFIGIYCQVFIFILGGGGGHWYPCFGFLVTSPMGFKARVGSALFAFFVEANVMYIPQDPLLLHMATCWLPRAQPVTSLHASAEVGLGSDLNGQLPGQKANALQLCQ